MIQYDSEAMHRHRLAIVLIGKRAEELPRPVETTS